MRPRKPTVGMGTVAEPELTDISYHNPLTLDSDNDPDFDSDNDLELPSMMPKSSILQCEKNTRNPIKTIEVTQQ